MLKPNSTWFDNPHGITRPSITKITIVDRYTPTGSEKSWDCSAEQDGSIKCYVAGTELTIAGNGSGKIVVNPQSAFLFCEPAKKNTFKNVTAIIGADLLNMSQATSLERCFQSCSKLTSVDVSTWDTSNVTNMNGTFSQCYALINPDVSNWKTGKVTDMAYMFQLARAVTALDLSKWDMSQVTTMAGMFQGHKSIGPMAIETIGNTDGWRLENCTSTQSMFSLCEKLKSISIGNWGMGKVMSCNAMFQRCKALVSIGNATNELRFTSCQDFGNMLYACESIAEIGAKNWVTMSAQHMRSMFDLCSSLKTLDATAWDTCNVTDMSYMFSSCKALTEIETSGWNVSKVITFRDMFKSSAVKAHGISEWDTASAEDMAFMFWGCTNVKSLDVSTWDVSHVTNFDHFIANSGIEIIGTGNWKVSKVCTNVNALFHSCTNEVIDISNCDFSGVITTSQMFDQCANLKKIIGIEKLATPNNVGPDEMFNSCTNLEDLDLSAFDTRNAKEGVEISGNGSQSLTCNAIFGDMPKLRKLTLGPDFSYNGDGTSTDPTHYAIMPTPDDPAYDGHWYNQIGEALLPEDACKNVPVTLYATKERMRSEPVMLQNGTLIDIGEAVRNKKADNLHRKPSEMKGAIDSITTLKPETAPTEVIKSNGKQTFNPPAGSVFSSFTADVQVPIPVVPETQEKEITITENGDYPITPDVDKVLSKVLAHVNIQGEGGGNFDPRIKSINYVPSSEGAVFIPFPSGVTVNNLVSVAVIRVGSYTTSSGDYGLKIGTWTRSISKITETKTVSMYAKDGFLFTTGKREKPIGVSSDGVNIHHIQTSTGSNMVPTDYVIMFVIK